MKRNWMRVMIPVIVLLALVFCAGTVSADDPTSGECGANGGIQVPEEEPEALYKVACRSRRRAEDGEVQIRRECETSDLRCGRSRGLRMRKDEKPRRDPVG